MRELGDRLDSRELEEWFAFYDLEPWGADIEDLRTGTICSAISSSVGVSTSPREWMPDREPAEPQTDDEIQRNLMATMAGFGMKVE